MAEHVGNCPCPETGEAAKVMADKRKKLYLNSESGVFKYQSAAGQSRLKARWKKAEPEKYAAFFGGAEEPERTPPVKASPEPKPEEKPPEPPEKSPRRKMFGRRG